LARWQFDENTDKINFTIESRNPEKKNKWTGIGFSNDPSMRLTDAIIGWVEPNGRHFIMDMWTTNYLNPILDSRQDITDMSGSLEDGKTTLRFTRNRSTGDKQDVAFTDTEGMYMIFPIKGGRYNGVNKKIRKHEEIPIPSTERIFIKNCRTADGKPTFTTTPKPPQLLYQANLKFVDTGNFKLPRQGTQEFTSLQQKISRSLRGTEISKVPGFEDVVVMDFHSKQDGEFDTELVIILNKEVFEAEAEKEAVKEALERSVEKGKIGHHSVDPSSLKLQDAVEQNQPTEEPRSLPDSAVPNVKLYVVVACIAALVLVAIVQASCTVFKMSRRGSSVHKEKLLGQSQWKDYSSHHGSHAAPPHHYNDSFETDGDPVTGGWGPPHRHNTSTRTYDRSGHQSLPRPQHSGHPGHGHHTLGHSSFDRRTGGFTARPPGPQDFPPDHYFLPSQRKYSGEVLRVPAKR